VDLTCKNYIKRAQNELNLADIILKLSIDTKIQLNLLKLLETETYFSAVIHHSYFCIFYSAKAYLLSKGIKTSPPEEHKNTFKEFEKLVEVGVVDVELLKIYKEMIIRADTLLGIFSEERKKRGNFTYHTLSQANRQPAEESVDNAVTFFKHIYNLIE